MLRMIISSVFMVWAGMLLGHENDSLTTPQNTMKPKVNFVQTRILNDSIDLNYVSNTELFQEEWNQLAHPVFWKTIMTLSPDSCVINIGSTRQIVEFSTVEKWDAKSDEEKEAYRDSIRKSYNLAQEAKIYMTTGKKDFY